MRRLLKYVGAYKKYALLAPITIAGEVLLEVLIPLVMAAIIDNGIEGGAGMPYILMMGALMVGMALVSLVLGALSGKFAAQASAGFAKNLREALFTNVQKFSFANVDKFSTASLVTRLTTDVTNAQNAFMMCIRVAFRAPIMLVLAMIMATTVNAELSTVFLVAIPVLAIVLGLLITQAFPRFKVMLKQYDDMNAMVQENLVGIRAVKAFVREGYETEKFKKRADGVRKAQVFAEKLIVLNMPVMQISMYACILAVLWFGGNKVMQGSMEIGQLSSFINYITQILMSLMMISMVFIMFVLSRASISRIHEVLNEQSDISDESVQKEVALNDGSIVFNNVSFSYAKDQENLTIKDINLDIHSGETVGIIGGTGSAKTTLVQLIPRLYDVLRGEVVVGGHNVKEYRLHTLRNNVAMVLQKNVLFSGTIRENLLWGDETASQEEIEEACKTAQAHDFIMAFPDGYDTELGQGGVNVSGGQKQRLCIARALLKKPKIIILDDSTSAVDTATDAKIREAFREKFAGTTTIIIAQRISSICDADKIIVLDDGCVNGVGTHDELMQNNEIYREVYESQQKGVA